MEMGFDEKEVMDALRVSNNQQSAAVSPGPHPSSPSCAPRPCCPHAPRAVKPRGGRFQCRDT